jgi:glutaredoxin 3
MSKIEIYTRKFCGYCSAAKDLLAKKGVAFNEFDASADSQLRAEMVQRSNGGRTFPQIFIDGRHIGGCDELYDLDQAGKLDPLLFGTSPA